MEQIRKKEYALKYATDKREIVLIGIGFDEEKKNIGEWLVEKHQGKV
ncbi:MAG: PD-(D/E)XK nuclease domain-containing protein [Bacteroidetes bacterium]|nr:PD-(D/E)XK nuclease domain-containing protein [Bacteroidota bacterium]